MTIEEFTGERYMPEVGGSIELEHFHRYLVASKLVANMRVLDVACGEGYGSSLLKNVASTVIGIDIDLKTVERAQQKYGERGLSFESGDCASLPLGNASVDAVVSFETIEHHDRHKEMMEEIKRVMVPEGLLIISSPDKYYFSDVPGYKSPFHVRELYYEEFEALLREHFSNVVVYKQKVLYGSVLSTKNDLTDFYSSEEVRKGGAGSSELKAPYLVALASNLALPEMKSSILETSIDNSEVVGNWRRAVDEREERTVKLASEYLREKEALLRKIEILEAKLAGKQ